ncbi:MAG TPA: alpha/beta fold hydrolase [Dermatophilaceae bacterium]|jgi:polyhydroxyalkanoate synthase|nr:MAG: Poly-beta-hydroxybutyrate polymerase [bacterium ADurb.BinA028]HNV14586.1 alpha/beta fold hydrolase [Dermatophilaceae bacterium]HOA03805.1 alpha/beta fold hydrolase [Dermatophilaceae bacterium]HOA58143.1 alpha/beta fold hydrolase [Dermatophilaceae bacterium]HOR15655.1 alpha/beta fold hydrolase [Dermatophilaceae bacterium]
MPPTVTVDPAEGTDDLAVPLDHLLVEAALGPLRRFAPDLSTARLLGSLASRPVSTGRRVGALAADLAAIVAGKSTVAPDRRDRRFADEAWAKNPLLRRLVQSYLASGATAAQLVSDAGLGWRDAQRVEFLLDNLTEALSPSNLPLVNPASAKAAIDTGGANFARGMSAFAKDMSAKPRVPQMVDSSGFELGRNIAVSPGAVIARTEVFELIRYQPSTPKVHEVPLLIVPPTINKFYAMDLAPGRSLVEFLVGQGQQVFIISWRNPLAHHADWDSDTYAAEIIKAMDITAKAAGVEKVALTGICSGGILSSLAVAHLAATDRLDRLAAFSLFVTVLDQEHAGMPAALAGPRTTDLAKRASRQRGFIDGRDLAEAFAWLRPGDLVWNYWVNNYLLGRRPPAFDILFWNADTVRMPAGLHADFIDIAMENRLVHAGTQTTLGTPVDLGEITTDAYVVAGIADHITPWQNCYQSTQLLGGDTRFILSTSGHIAALVNPPNNPKASYRDGSTSYTDANEWLENAEQHPGAWWPDYAAWLAARSGALVKAPTRLDGGGTSVLAQAPGTYVLEP